MEKGDIPQELVEKLGVTDVVTVGDATAMSGARTYCAKSNGAKIFIKVDDTGLLKKEVDGMIFLKQIDWPGALPILDYGPNWIVCPYVEGKTVFSLIKDKPASKSLLLALTEYYSNYSKKYLENMSVARGRELAGQPWQMLFSERYDRSNPESRVNTRYVNRMFKVGDTKIPYEELQDYTWKINQRDYLQTFKELISCGYETMLFSGRSKIPVSKVPIDDHSGNQILVGGKIVVVDQPYCGLAPLPVAMCKMIADTLLGYMFYDKNAGESRNMKISVDKNNKKIIVDYDDSIEASRIEIMQIIRDNTIIPIMKKIRQDYPAYVNNDFRSDMKAFYAACLWPVFDLNNLSDKTRILLMARTIEYGFESPEDNRNFLDARIDALLESI